MKCSEQRASVLFYMDFSSVSIVLALSVPLDSFLNAYWSGVYLSVQPVYKGNELNWSLQKNASRKKKDRVLFLGIYKWP